MSSINWLRYAGHHSFGIANSDVFQSYAVQTAQGTTTVRSMLTYYELLLLYALAKDWYKGAGEIIDAGPLLGLSTYAMAQGVAQNKKVAIKSHRIHSFDLFLSFDMGWHVDGCGPGTGSVFDRFLEINRERLEFISISPGDLLHMQWNAKPIELMFIDVAKTWNLNAWILRNWFPALIPGQSMIVQQDYIYFHQYWVAITMAWLEEYFERCEEVWGASVLFRNLRSIPAEKLAADLSSFPLAEKARLMEKAMLASSPSAREVLKCGLAYCMVEHGEIGEARRILDSVRPVAGPEPKNDFSGIAASNVKIVSDIIESRTANCA